MFWQRSPVQNLWWTIASIGLVISHTIFCYLEIALFVKREDKESGPEIPMPLIGVAFSWLLILVPLNTLVKRKEIKANNRQQRRARLDFNTKLGMNSPF